MAMASPPRVMVLKPVPMAARVSTPASIDNGSAVSEITVVRQFARNTVSSRITRTAASIRWARTLPMAVSMNRACRNPAR